MANHPDKKLKNKMIQNTLFGFIILCVCTIFTCYIFESNLKDVVINYNGHVYGMRTIEETYEDFIQTNNIYVNKDHDFINVALNKPLKTDSTNRLLIKSAVPVHILYDEQEKTVYTYLDTVDEVLREHQVPLYEHDHIKQHDLNTQIIYNMTIQVVRVTKGVEVKNTSIPYSLLVEENDTMPVNETRVVQQGQIGENTQVFEIRYEDGKEVDRTLILDEDTVKPVDQIIEYGTIPVKRIPGTDEYFQYLEASRMVATAYTLHPDETGGKEPGHPYYGITYSGIPAVRGVIAVDPRVIPLGTKVYVESLDSRFPDYGVAIAADIGSAIKGDKIDLFMDDRSEAFRWGIRDVKVYIIHED